MIALVLACLACAGHASRAVPIGLRPGTGLLAGLGQAVPPARQKAVPANERGPGRSLAVASAFRNLRPGTQSSHKLAIKNPTDWSGRKATKIQSAPNNIFEDAQTQERLTRSHVELDFPDKKDEDALVARLKSRLASHESIVSADESSVFADTKIRSNKLTQTRTGPPTQRKAPGKQFLLTSEEVKVLSRRVQKLVRWESTRDMLEDSSGHKATLDEWSRACGFQSVIEFNDALREAQEARHTFIASNMGLVVSFAKRYQFIDGSLSLQDLIQEGSLGLVKAVDRFDPERGVKFSTYAYFWINSTLLMALRKNSRSIRLPIGMQEDLRHLARVTAEILERTGRDPTDEELMERMEISKKRLVVLQDQRKRGQGHANALPDGFESWAQLPFQDAASLPGEDDSVKHDVDSLLQNLSADEVELLQLRFGMGGAKPMKYAELAVHLGVSRTSAANYVNRALAKLRVQTQDMDPGDWIDSA